MNRCRFCATENPDRALHCRACGVALPPLVAATAPLSSSATESSTNVGTPERAPTVKDAPQPTSTAPLPSGAKDLGRIAIERGGRLTEREAVVYVRRAAALVAALHEGGRSHGAISETSVGLDGTGQIVLSPVGAPAPGYESSRDADTRALARLLFRLLAGRPPHVQETQWPGSLSVANALQKALWSHTEAVPPLEAWVAQLVPHPATLAAAAPSQSTLSPLAVPSAAVPSALASPENALPGAPPQSTFMGLERSRPAAPAPTPVIATPIKASQPAPSLATPSLATPSLAVAMPKEAPVLVRRIAATNGRFIRVAWAADGEVWSANENGVAQIWSARTGACAASLPMHARSGEVTCAAFASSSAPNLSGIASDVPPANVSSVDGKNSGARRASGEAGNVSSTVASGHEDGSIRLWDARGNRLRRTFAAHKGRVSALALLFHPNGSRLASGGGDGALLWWDIDAGKQANALAESSMNIKVLAVAPDGAFLAAGGDGGRLDVWNARSGQRAWTSQEHEFWLTALAFSSDGKMLASGAYDRTIRLWSSDAGAPLQTLSGHEALINSLHFSPRGRVLASASADGSARLWDSWTGESGPILRGWNGSANALAFSPGGRFLAVAADDSLTIWKFEA